MEILELVDHCELDHEYEIAPGTSEAKIRKAHASRHRGDTRHLNHSHNSDGTVRYAHPKRCVTGG
jgi:hypothetical protein